MSKGVFYFSAADYSTVWITQCPYRDDDKHAGFASCSYSSFSFWLGIDGDIDV